jgi:hypothetical protein
MGRFVEGRLWGSGNRGGAVRRRTDVKRVWGLGALVLVLAVTAGCGEPVERAAASTTTAAATTMTAATTTVPPSTPTLPPDVAAWLADFGAGSSAGRADSADWVLTTRRAGAVVFGAGIPDDTAVYVIDLHGDFAWEHSCPAGAPPEACRSVGDHVLLTLDPATMCVLDFGVVRAPADLSSLGEVGHVDL